MAEGILAGGSQHRPSVLLATKLFIPPVRSGFVARPRLRVKLDRVPVRLTLIAAPAGFGKSSVVADWARHRPETTTWLSLDPGDNDPARFWRYVCAALDTVLPGLRDRIEPLIVREAAPVQTVVDVLLNDLADDASRVALVLDDFHLIRSRIVHESVDHFIERAPSNVSVTIVTRSDPPLQLSRLRASGELTEIGVRDLRFVEEEARSMLEQATGIFVSDKTATVLTERTEGWVAGLQLAGLSLRESANVDAFVRNFSGTHRHVVDYLTSEVLASQNEEIRDFLVRTSILDRLSAELCDAMLDRSDSQVVLESIERANLFLIPLDADRVWWRYHHLFAELLRARLRAETDDLERELHRRASSWHEQHGNDDEAIGHARAAGDVELAARLAERYADARLLLNEGATLRGWIDALPDEVVQTRPRLLLAEANLALVSGDYEAFGAPFAAAERAYGDTEDGSIEQFEPSSGERASLLGNLPASIALGRAHLAELHGDADETRRQALTAQSFVQPDEWMLDILVSAHLAIAEFLCGNLETSAAGFERTLARCQASGERVVAGRDAELLGRCYRGLGKLAEALDCYSRVAAYLTDDSDRLRPMAGRLLVAAAAVEYQRNDLDAAAQHLEQGIGLCRDLANSISGSPQPLADALATRAWLSRARGDEQLARANMEEAISTAPGPAVTSILNDVPAQRARLLISDGDLASAGEWAADSGVDDVHEPSFAREPEHVAFARLLIARGELERAERLLKRLATDAISRPGSLIEIQVLRAIAKCASGDVNTARGVLSRALESAAPGRWTRVFVDEGPHLHDLLRTLAGRRHPADRPEPLSPEAWRHLLFVLDAFEASQPGKATPLSEALSERELEVLQLIAAGRPNADIAQTLFVTPDTVKKHVTHILGKLGVSNRTEAAARARELSLIS